MDVKGSGCAAKTQVKVQQHSENEMGIRKGPWTVDEDTILVNYITIHGEGHWNSVARFAGLRRSGKSCRLRWLNYLRPDVRRGNITLQEQILILELHSRWGNRWSKIAKHLPGRTDNEIKNYWRTRVIKQAKQLKCDVNSEQFRDTLRHVWMPRMLERVNPSGVGLGGFLHRTGFLGSGTDWAQPNRSHSDSSSSAEFLAPSNSNNTDSSGSVHGSDSDLWSGFNNQVLDQVSGGHESLGSLWGEDNFWFLQQLSE